MEEMGLLQQACQGDKRAFNCLVTRYQDLLFRQAFSLMGDEQLAEDLTQDAILRAYTKLDQCRIESFRPWLLRIVINLCLDELRRRKRRPVSRISLDEDGESLTTQWLVSQDVSPEKTVEDKEQQMMLANCLVDLPLLYRIPILLVDVNELSYSEAASAIGVSKGTLKSRLARGRVKVQTAFRHLCI